MLSGLSQLVVVWGIVACGVALGSRYGDGSVVIDRHHENGSLPRELLFQQEVGQQGLECLEEGRATGDLYVDLRGRKVCVGPGSRLVGGVPGQARGS